MLHSVEEIAMELIVFFLILFSPPFKKKSNKVWLVEKGKLEGELKRVDVDFLSVKNGDCKLTTILR